LKKILIGIFILFVFVLLYFSFHKKSPFLEYKLNNKTYKLLTAKDSAEWQKGLMFYKNKKDLNGADGMIFIFPKEELLTFWNENTYLDLEVYWLDNDKVVGKSFLPSILKSKNIITVNSGKEVNRVVEIVKE
jgi:uncharacterized membrane protein (UPF0127 family)